MSSVVAERRDTRAVPETVERLVTSSWWIYEEKSFPVQLILRATAREAPIRSWRVVSDGRRWLRSGNVEIELTGTPSQIAAFRRRLVSSFGVRD